MLDAQRFGVDEEPCLSVRHLSKRFGAGCPHCLAPAAQLERNVCPRCGTVHAVRDVSLLVVSHDRGVNRMLADRTLVMLDGRVIESGLTDQILEDPQHAYTQQLVYSLL